MYEATKTKITHKNTTSNIKTLQKIRPVKKQIKQIKWKISKNRKKTKQRNQTSEEDRIRKSSTEA